MACVARRTSSVMIISAIVNWIYLFVSSSPGTVRWMAPEVFADDRGHYNEKCDVYSWAITLWEVMARRIPFHHLENHQVVIQKQHIGGIMISYSFQPWLGSMGCCNEGCKAPIFAPVCGEPRQTDEPVLGQRSRSKANDGGSCLPYCY